MEPENLDKDIALFDDFTQEEQNMKDSESENDDLDLF